VSLHHLLLSVEKIMPFAFSAGSALKNWFASRWFAPRRRQRRAVKKAPFYRLPLRLEQLEDRLVPATPTVDLTTPGAFGSINGAIFKESTSIKAGTGVLDPFLRIDLNGKTGVEQGWNNLNSGTNTGQFNEHPPANFTHPSAVSIAGFGGQQYYEFVLDINQTNSNPLLSLDELRIYVTHTQAADNSYDPTTGKLDGNSPVYDMNPDLSANNYVLLDNSLASGSGAINMILLVPVSVIGTNPSDFLYLYSEFGVHNPANDGFEEWANRALAKPTITTTPGPTVVLGSGTKMTDSATLTGGDTDNPPTGTITFQLFAPNATTVVDTETVTVHGDGTYTTPNGFLPTAAVAGAGTYHWVASYSGDLNNSPFTSDPNAEPEKVIASPSVVTLASPTGTIALGTGTQTLNDSATLSGGLNPTGSITFTLDFNNGSTTTTVYTDTVTVSGNGTYTTATGNKPGGWTLPSDGSTVAGTYTWHAHYSGDGNNSADDDQGGADEQVTVTPASPSVVTLASPTGTIALGIGTQTLNDSATLSGGYFPGGSIIFTLDFNDGSNTTQVYTDTVTVSGNGTYTTATGNHPGGFPLPSDGKVTGTYTWHAHYSGDGNNSADDDQGGADEQVTVTPASPTITTQASASTGAGGSLILSDQVTVIGGFHPTGTVTFTLHQPDNTTITVGTVTINGDGNYNAPTVVATQVGTYTWHASYSGDGNNNGAVDNGVNESVTTNKANPTISTQASVTGGSVAGTAVLSDTVTVSGGNNPTGTVTFTLTRPDGTVVPEGSVTINGDGTYNAPSTVLATQAGTYTWHASYSGDGLNNGTVDNGANESVTTTKASPTITTTPGPTVALHSNPVTALADTADLEGGVNPTGTITFELFAPGNTTTPVDTEKVAVNGNGVYSTPTGFVPAVAGTYQWVATYSGDSNNQTVSSPLGDEPENAVDAKISISPLTPVNEVKDQETFTITVTAFPAGTGTPTFATPTVSVSPTPGLTNGPVVGPVAGFPKQNADGTWTDEWTYTINSAAAGTFTVQASDQVTMDGVTVTRTTGDGFTSPDGSDSPSAVKTYESITTTAGPTVTLGSGTALNDSATLAGGTSRTGTVTFQLFAPGVITPVYTDVVTLTGAAAPVTVNTSMGDHPGGFVPTALGTYQWVVTYNSTDEINPSVSSPFGDEPETVVPAAPTITTTPGGTVTVGQGVPLTDSATLAGGFNPTGTITFTLFGPGNTVVDTEVVQVHGNGIYGTPTGFVPTVAGTYQWVATYSSGDSNNNGAVSPFGSEPETAKAASVTPVIISKQVFISSNLGKHHKKPHHHVRKHHKAPVRPHHG
jgi:hypothetical protein